MNRQITVGAVAYDPRVVTIWEGIRNYFELAGVPTDYVLYSTYEAQVRALFEGSIDIAWNTNTAYVRCMQKDKGCVALAMRDSDRDFTTRLVADNRKGITGLESLKGKQLALGSADSAQASIVPLHVLRQARIEPGTDVEIIRFDRDIGKHGDTGTSELQVLQAIHEGKADAGMIGHVAWLKQLELGAVNSSLVESVWTSPPYDHCNFTVLPGFDTATAKHWTDALLKMDYRDERWRRLMDLEGVTEWLPARTDGYKLLFEAMSE